LIEIGDDKDYFFTISQGIFETNIVTSKNLEDSVKKLFSKELMIYSHIDLASITIKLPKTNVEQSGVYYFILKQLAWAGISVQEIISTTHEMTIVVKEEDVNSTFSILIDMKKK
jgi:aspartokinase